MEQAEERITSALLAFIDFLYAVVFGLVLSQTFEEVVLEPTKTTVEKIINVLLVVGVFYFLSWDWLHGRRLTVKNPYKGYGRFFIEVIIAFLAYGAALGAIEFQIYFLICLSLILLLGSLWAKMTIKEYPESEDKYELMVILIYQTVFAIAGGVSAFIWYKSVNKAAGLFEVMSFMLFGFVFLLYYDIWIERLEGVMGGPGVPFVSKRIIAKLRKRVFRE